MHLFLTDVKLVLTKNEFLTTLCSCDWFVVVRNKTNSALSCHHVCIVRLSKRFSTEFGAHFQLKLTFYCEHLIK